MKKNDVKRMVCMLLAALLLFGEIGGSFAVTANAASTQITVNGMKDLTTVQGTGVHLEGTVTAKGSQIVSINATVSNTGISKTVSGINKKSYKLYDSKLDYALPFGSLAAGNYTITLTVKTADGTSKKFTCKLTVNGIAKITASGIAKLETTVGTGTHLIGKLKSSGSKIYSVKAVVEGTSLSKTQKNINSYSFALENSELDYAMTFGGLPAGTYKITYTVKTVDGTTKSFSSTITIQAKAEPDASIGKDGTGTYKNMKEYVKGGSTYYVIKGFDSKYCFDQNDYDRFLVWDSNAQKYKNKGCTATACAIVLCMAGEKNAKNQLITPDLYPWDAANGGIAWDYMTSHRSEGKSQYLKQIVQELLDGKAVALWANDYHCVTAVGIRKGADLNNPTASDLLIVDPYGGDVTTLNQAEHGGYVYYGYRFYTAS